MHTCPECQWEEVPAPWMKCLPCVERLVALWVAERDAPSEKAPLEVKPCAGVMIAGNHIRCGRRVDQSGTCKKHRELVALGQATAA